MFSEKQRKISAQRRAFDELFEELRKLQLKNPEVGWTKTIRALLGMPVRYLAKKLKIDTTTLTRLEGNEVKGTITLNSLKRLAHELDCDFQYAFVPRKKLIQILGERADKVLERESRKAARSMDLEDQGGEVLSDRRTAILKAMLAETLDKRLWMDNED